MLNMAESTVRKVIKENEDNLEYANLCEQKKAKFATACA